MAFLESTITTHVVRACYFLIRNYVILITSECITARLSRMSRRLRDGRVTEV